MSSPEIGESKFFTSYSNSSQRHTQVHHIEPIVTNEERGAKLVVHLVALYILIIVFLMIWFIVCRLSPNSRSHEAWSGSTWQMFLSSEDVRRVGPTSRRRLPIRRREAPPPPFQVAVQLPKTGSYSKDLSELPPPSYQEAIEQSLVNPHPHQSSPKEPPLPKHDVILHI